jgi:hypothetical protein
LVVRDTNESDGIMYRKRVTTVQQYSSVNRGYSLQSALGENTSVTMARDHPGSESLRHVLTRWRSKSGPVRSLKPYQVNVVDACVYRPSVNVDGHSYDISYEKNSFTDIGNYVVNDLPPGSGKTLTTSLALIYFADRRGFHCTIPSISQRLVRFSRNDGYGDSIDGVNVTEAPVDVPEFSDHVIIFCPKSVVEQWENAVNLAMDILLETEILQSRILKCAQFNHQSYDVH